MKPISITTLFESAKIKGMVPFSTVFLTEQGVSVAYAAWVDEKTKQDFNKRFADMFELKDVSYRDICADTN